MVLPGGGGVGVAAQTPGHHGFQIEALRADKTIAQAVTLQRVVVQCIRAVGIHLHLPVVVKRKPAAVVAESVAQLEVQQLTRRATALAAGIGPHTGHAAEVELFRSVHIRLAGLTIQHSHQRPTRRQYLRAVESVFEFVVAACRHAAFFCLQVSHCAHQLPGRESTTCNSISELTLQTSTQGAGVIARVHHLIAFVQVVLLIPSQRCVQFVAVASDQRVGRLHTHTVCTAAQV